MKSRNDLEKEQLKLLRETVKLVLNNSPFYKKLYEKKGLSEETLQSLKDLERFPFTTARDLAVFGKDMICVPQSEISRVVTLETSGTTAEPKRVYFTEADQELTVEFFHRGMRNIADERDRVLILMPCARPGSVGDLLNTGLKRLGAETVAYGLIGDGGYEKVIDLMAAKEITCIVGIPFQMEKLLEISDRISLKSVLLSADYIPSELCVRLKKEWGAEVYEHYGMTEMGLGCAVSCSAEPNGKGYHVRERDIYIEIIDPVTGMVAPDGQYGEVVFTTLTRKGMPFIRYRTGDISRWRTEPCGCRGTCLWGGGFRKIDKVGARNMKKGGG